MTTKKKVGVITGPTGVGKTRLSLEVAERLEGEIINGDATALYRGMDIGTDKPKPQERARVPHHLLDVADPSEGIHVARYAELVQEAVADILLRGKKPLLVGGSILYIRAATLGYRFPPVPPDPAFRQAMERRASEEGKEALYRELLSIDPEVKAFIHPHNVRRVIRALEIYRATGEPPSRHLRRPPQPTLERRVVALTRPRDQLRRLIRERIDRELAEGFIQEVEELLRRYPKDLPAFQTLGYREIIRYLEGELTREELPEAIFRRTWQLARRQYTWLRREEDVLWLDLGALDFAEAVDRTVAIFADFFSAP
ncbi:MAG: tRNA (adenosine(37)-N6)-dimethylallyltransferase MiaA [Clostridiales bacterium]|nr:tRNA (adenosine(37)-N6)-dimethylallyltransferase MiaA [Clostridiales bacterium]